MKAGEASSLDIATAGHPVLALSDALGQLLAGDAPEGWHVTVAHDPDCPSVTPRRGLPDCTCEIVRLTVRKAQQP